MINQMSSMHMALTKLGVPTEFLFPVDVTVSLVMFCIVISCLVKLFDWVVYNYFL